MNLTKGKSQDGTFRAEQGQLRNINWTLGKCRFALTDRECHYGTCTGLGRVKIGEGPAPFGDFGTENGTTASEPPSQICVKLPPCKILNTQKQ